MKRYFEYFGQKPGLRLVTIVILVLLGAALYLGVLSAREMKRMINEDFNAQQLALAKHAAGILVQNVKILKRELMTLSLSPSIQYTEAVSWPNRMKIQNPPLEFTQAFPVIFWAISFACEGFW